MTPHSTLDGTRGLRLSILRILRWPRTRRAQADRTTWLYLDFGLLLVARTRADQGREKSLVFLRFMLEDRHSLAEQFGRTQGHGHLDLVGAPLLPGTTVEPDLAVLIPIVLGYPLAGL